MAKESARIVGKCREGKMCRGIVIKAIGPRIIGAAHRTIKKNNSKMTLKKEDGGETTQELKNIGKKRIQGFGKLAVVGDLHGDFDSMKSVLNLVDPTRDCIIFLGDYADRGLCGVEVIAAVDSLIREHPTNVFALQGNHELYYLNGEPKFGLNRHNLIHEVETKMGNWHDYFRRVFMPFVNRLHVAIMIPGEALFVHGGVSYGIRELDDLRCPNDRTIQDILWSDPVEEPGESIDLLGRPKFGPDVSKRICQRLKVKKIIRSHEPSRVNEAGGPCYSHDGKVLTTSSTRCGPGYKPYVLSINPADFSIKCLRIDANPPAESEVVNCGALAEGE